MPTPQYISQDGGNQSGLGSFAVVVGEKFVNILVVEDEPLIRLGVVSMLEDAGFVALEASNADDAIRKLQEHEDVSVVITDIDMPGSMDGIKLAHFIRGRWPPINLIVMSGKLRPTENDLPSGAHFFSKPYQERRLLNVIRELAGGGEHRA